MSSFTPELAAKLAGPDWLRRRREEAAERFEAEPMPGPEAEEWRYSPIGELDLDRFSLTNGAGDPTPASTPVPDPLSGAVSDPAATVVVVDGHVRDLTVRADAEGAGLKVTVPSGAAGAPADATDATADGDEATALGAVTRDAADHFTTLNDAFAEAPVVIHVPAGVRLEHPIVVHHHASTDGAATFPRIVVTVGADAQAEVVDVVTSAPDATTLVVPVTELDVAAAGRLGYVNLQLLGPRAWQIASHVARAGQDSHLTAASAGFGGAYARTRADSRMFGRGAHGELLSLYFGDDDQTLDFRTYQDHVAPDTTSNLLYKGAVGGRARSIYTGLIRVRPEARGTNAFQTNRNLKLSDDAWAESVPNLEIENNDVKCSHASAVGPIDEEQRFYLESRGVPTDVAERLVVAGFFSEVITALPVPAVAPVVRRAVVDKLARVDL